MATESHKIWSPSIQRCVITLNNVVYSTETNSVQYKHINNQIRHVYDNEQTKIPLACQPILSKTNSGRENNNFILHSFH